MKDKLCGKLLYPVGESMKNSETLVISFPCSREFEKKFRIQPRPKHTVDRNLTHAARTNRE
jgi:hypothetical protein